jgi:hypothetical protein
MEECPKKQNKKLPKSLTIFAPALLTKRGTSTAKANSLAFLFFF